MRQGVVAALAVAAFFGARSAFAQMPSPPAPPHAPDPAAVAPSGTAGPPAAASGGEGAFRPAAASAPSPVQPSGRTKAMVNNAVLADTGVDGGVSPVILRAEVMLDRLHDSPGVIDGRDGENFQHALEMFEKTHDLPAGKRLDDKSWAALTKASGAPALMDYTLTAKDVEGPYYPDLPKDYAKLAQLKTLGYRSPAQKIGAKFHMSEELLAALNPGVDLAKAGNTILVADIKAQPVTGKVHKIIVDKAKSQVLGYNKHGKVIVAYPATIGSEELPSPSGTYKVKGVAWNPIYYYNPKNFVQGDNTGKLQLPPGPNNPVGKVFIALTKPTYGLHGTPDPSKIDKTASHGCVRMTNWDATELAHLVRPGIVVSFRH